MAAEPKTAKVETAPGLAKCLRLAYNPPLLIFYPTALLFILVNYLAFGTVTDETSTKRLLPANIAAYAASRDRMREVTASGTSPAESPALNAVLFFEQHVMGTLFAFGLRIFQSLFGIQIMCLVAWMVHLFELGMCFRICFACNASVVTTALYMGCTALGGFSQLGPMTAARNEWVAEVRGSDKVENGKPAKESKKSK